MRVFLDANILFSASKTDGAIRELLRLLVEQGHELWIDEFVLVEARRNLERKDAEALLALGTLLRGLRCVPHSTAAGNESDLEWLHEKDRPVLAAAIRAKCDVLLTGDRTHFGAGYGRMFRGVTVHSPRSLARLVLAD